MRHLICLTLLIALVGCKTEPKAPETESLAKRENPFNERFRPQYHFTPPTHWMNDPNGLVYHNGTYHLFYQYYPEDIVWGPMHWGHATSTDLVDWEHQAVALFPDELGYIFSGSAVMDIQNTSGLGTEDKPAMVAFYTYHDAEGEKEGRNDFQTQGMAFSLDEGETWTKYEGNPVIGNPDNIRDFRDPKVFWHEASKRWVLVLVAGDHAKIYTSPNLKDWTYQSDFGKDQGAHGGVWECPDLFELEIGETREKKWVLLISINPGAPNGGSGTQYFVGDFDGKKFTSTQTEPKWIDYGTDNYAGVTYNNMPENERIFIGWMSNWNYAQKTPTQVWRSAMTLSRKLSLHKAADYYLKSIPVDALNNYTELAEKRATVRSGDRITEASWNDKKLSFTIPGTLTDFKVVFSNVLGESVCIAYDAEAQQFLLDRTHSGLTDFEPRFADQVHEGPFIAATDQPTTLTLYLDRSSLELFVNEGELVMTEQLFPTQPYTELLFESPDQVLTNFKYATVKSIWTNNQNQ
ncbi:glycoside hydrolase family 32 protein [Croceiramulus getboli]|nr:glycoside hydrolase family 32 protein [Flavobacteriaceae bacterium YJPT1-3]